MRLHHKKVQLGLLMATRLLPLISPKIAAVWFSALMVCTSSAQTLPDKLVVKGTFLGDGKDGKIQYLVVQTREPFSDKAAIKLVFTEKNPAASKKPDFDAGFKKLGSALVLSVFRDGGIFGCEVAHTAHEKSPFSALGTIKMKDFTVTETHVSGQVSTGGEQDAFGQKWEVELTFSAPLPKGAFAAVSEPAPEPKKTAKAESEMPVDAGPKMPVAQLPLPVGAADVEYKKVVEHIVFRSDTSLSAVVGDFSAKLKKQGWKDSPGGLMSKASAILTRKLNGAELTIMAQPAGSGCTVKVFTKGLDWSDTPASASPPAEAKPAKSGDAGSIEAEAKRLLDEAMKKVPKGF
jgi:hypothetical protein